MVASALGDEARTTKLGDMRNQRLVSLGITLTRASGIAPFEDNRPIRCQGMDRLNSGRRYFDDHSSISSVDSSGDRPSHSHL